jgi:hypothetical protein
VAERWYADLEAALADLRQYVDYPPTPDVAARVRARLRAGAPRRSAWPRPLPALAAILAVALLVTGLLALWPAAREAVAERLGLPGVQITQVTETPQPVAGSSLGLGQPIGLEDARRRVSYALQLPAALAAPDTVYFLDVPVGGQVAFVFAPRNGMPMLLLSEFEGNRVGIGKGLPPGTRIEDVSVSGNHGLWIEGDPHVFFFVDAQGRSQSATTRLAANVLLWENNRLTLRLESTLTRDAAVQIASSTR